MFSTQLSMQVIILRLMSVTRRIIGRIQRYQKESEEPRDNILYEKKDKRWPE